MKLLFTGASGFLGNGIRSLLDRMYTVATVGLLSQNDYTVNIANEIPELHERYDIILQEKPILCPEVKPRNRCFLM